MLDRTIERVADPVDAEPARRGAARRPRARRGATEHEVRDLVAVDATFRPDPRTGPTYDRLYAEFPKLYKAQKAMFRRLNRPATGRRQSD